MKKFVKIIAGATAIIMLASGLAGCGNSEDKKNETEKKVEINKTGYPIVNEPLTLNAFAYGEPGAGQWNDYPVFKDIAKQTGININFETVSGDGANEKLNLRLASKDNLPDIFFSGVSSTLITKYANMGIFIPLEDLISEYAPNLTAVFEQNPAYKKAMTMPDGHIYSIGTINERSSKTITTMLWVNKTWLDNLGLEPPKTTEDFKAMLEAFKNDDPNKNGEKDEIPFSYEPRPPYNIWNGDTGFSGAFGVVDDSSNMMLKDNKLVFMPFEKGFKEYVEWTENLYTEGLIDPEIFTQDHNQYSSKMNSKYLGAYLATGPGQGGDEWIAIDPLTGPNGDKTWSSFDYSVDRNRATLTVANKNPEATIRLIDSFFAPENTLKLKHGKSLAKSSEDGKWKLKQLETGEQSLAPGPYVPTLESESLMDMKELSEQDIADEKRKQRYMDVAMEGIPLITFTPEESKEISGISVDIKEYVSEMKAKWTTGQSDINADYDGFKDRLGKMKIDRYIEIYNTAYERFKNS